jgi:hypothetical protein
MPGRDQHAAIAEAQRRHDAGEQAEIMVERQPTDAARRGVGTRADTGGARVQQDRAMGVHDRLGQRGRSRRELQERDVLFPRHQRVGLIDGTRCQQILDRREMPRRSVPDPVKLVRPGQHKLRPDTGHHCAKPIRRQVRPLFGRTARKQDEGGPPEPGREDRDDQRFARRQNHGDPVTRPDAQSLQYAGGGDRLAPETLPG